MKHIDYAYTHGMDDAYVEAQLRSAKTGVLALSRENDAYAVPMAHYYDGDDLYIRLGTTAGSTKQAFLESTETACYVVYGAEQTDDPKAIESWSVVVTGHLTELSDDDAAVFDTAEINRCFSPIRVFDEPVEEIDIRIIRLDIETMTGRTTPID